MEDTSPVIVTGEGGLRGAVQARSAPGGEGDGRLLIRLESGRQVVVPEALLTLREDGSYYLPMALAELEAYAESAEPLTIVVPVVAEELLVSRQKVPLGGVRVRTKVEEHEVAVDEPAMRERIDVERVPINREIDRPASVRQEGDTTVVPLMEEVIHIEKRLMLREELRITKRRETAQEPQTVTLRRQVAVVEKMDPSQQASSEAGKSR